MRGFRGKREFLKCGRLDDFGSVFLTVGRITWTVVAGNFLLTYGNVMYVSGCFRCCCMFS